MPRSRTFRASPLWQIQQNFAPGGRTDRNNEEGVKQRKSKGDSHCCFVIGSTTVPLVPKKKPSSCYCCNELVCPPFLSRVRAATCIVISSCSADVSRRCWPRCSPSRSFFHTATTQTNGRTDTFCFISLFSPAHN